MNKPPENLSVGHAITYVLLYTAKYNDGVSLNNEFHQILNSLKYWMGNDTNDDEIKEILISTDEWFNSGSNYERTEMLDNVIDLIKQNAGENDSILNEIFEDCIRVTASNDADLNEMFSTTNHDVRINLLAKLFDSYPLLKKLEEKLIK